MAHPSSFRRCQVWLLSVQLNPGIYCLPQEVKYSLAVLVLRRLASIEKSLLCTLYSFFSLNLFQ